MVTGTKTYHGGSAHWDMPKPITLTSAVCTERKNALAEPRRADTRSAISTASLYSSSTSCRTVGSPGAGERGPGTPAAVVRSRTLSPSRSVSIGLPGDGWASTDAIVVTDRHRKVSNGDLATSCRAAGPRSRALPFHHS
ncbi:hypothetical protein SALBM217S_05704 [Streptomyces griseoloalbus]